MKPTAFSILLLALLPAIAGEPVSLLNGKDLANWRFKDKGANHWVPGTATISTENNTRLDVKEGGAELVNKVTGHNQGCDISTEQKFGDMLLELEVMVPKGSNSGIYLMGEYEVQVFDSHGVAKPGPGDMGALYAASVPKVNASKPPGEWQKYVIEFRAPRFDADGKRTENAKFLKVELNGTVLHENVEMKGPTPGGLTGKEAAQGPLMFQGDHGAVAFRNIKITPRP
jgi:Domain of Unknown Function (DUF1080)